MTSRLVFLRSGLIVALCGVVNGCNSGGDGVAIRKPAMPTMAPASSSPPVNVPEDEIFITAVRLVRDNDVAAAVATLRSA